jgi:hypothetical protein
MLGRAVSSNDKDYLIDRLNYATMALSMGSATGAQPENRVDDGGNPPRRSR